MIIRRDSDEIQHHSNQSFDTFDDDYLTMCIISLYRNDEECILIICFEKFHCICLSCIFGRSFHLFDVQEQPLDYAMFLCVSFVQPQGTLDLILLHPLPYREHAGLLALCVALAAAGEATTQTTTSH